MDVKDPSLLREQCLAAGRRIGAAAVGVANAKPRRLTARVSQFGGREVCEAIEKAYTPFPTWAKKTAEQCARSLGPEGRDFVGVNPMPMAGLDR